VSNLNINKSYKINPYINKKNQSIFAGIGVAVVTPFTENNEIDKEAIYKLSDHLFFNGISYVVVQGTTGESSVLNHKEKNLVNSFFIDAFKDRLPLILGMSSNDTRYLCDLISRYDFSGFEAIMSVCPYYNKPSQNGMFQHFANISDISPLPLILYNVPGRTSCDISNNTIIKLSEYSKNIIGIKEASGDPNRVKELRKKIKRDFLIISGDDFTMIDAIRNGADGIISVAANAFPSLMNDAYLSLLWEKEKNKPNVIELLPKVDKSNFILNDFFNLIFDEGNPAGIKFALKCLSLCSDKVRLPLTEISNDLKSKISDFMSKINV
tara:strand:- start:231 stop:1202 length:972 start_codon:yes stop_codon:yes gene_type:complete